jgi:IclR family pca regulon transcriptional regulator
MSPPLRNQLRAQVARRRLQVREIETAHAKGDYRLVGRLSNMAARDEIEFLSGDPNFMTSLARGLAVIRGFSRENRQMSIAQLSRRTGIPRAAVRRCLYTLVRLGYVNSGDGRT